MKKLTITGNVGRDAELRANQLGDPFVAFSVAVATGTRANPKTDWIEVTCNGRLVEVASNYVRKGVKVLVEGFPSVNAYINNDNLPVGTLRLYAHTLELLSSKTETSAESSATFPEVHDLPPQAIQATPANAEPIAF
ncbi:MAG: single-stranded DNA-binding protein [Burkholderiales bacterium]